MPGFFSFGGGTRHVPTLVTGLPTSGKTTIIYKLKLGEIVTTVPTTAPAEPETVEYKKTKFHLIDCPLQRVDDVIDGGLSGGSGRAKGPGGAIAAIIFVVDSQSPQLSSVEAPELRKLIDDPALQSAPLLVFANKQDLPRAKSCAKVREELNLHQLRNRVWYIQGSCSMTGDGLYEGLDWLAGVTKSKKK